MDDAYFAETVLKRVETGGAELVARVGRRLYRLSTQNPA